MTLKTLLGAAALTLASLGTAQAVTVDNVANIPSAWGEVDLGNTLDIGTGSWLGGDKPEEVTGSVGGQYRSPFQGGPGTVEADLPYWNLRAGDSATLVYDTTQYIFSILWGSVDTYNKIQFFNGAGDVTGVTVTSADLTDPNPTPGAQGGASFVRISGLAFDRVELSSSGNSFEFSNAIAAVPLPAGGVLLLTALGGLALARRRKG